MDISSFDDLLLAARGQAEPQRLLFVFAGTELPDDSNPEQRAAFEAGCGGALVPLMMVDKDAAELQDFGALAQESEQLQQGWSIVFAAALSGSRQCAPSSTDTERALERMVEAVRRGEHGAFIPFDRQGYPVLFE